MDTCGIDERLREVYESNAPVVDEPAFAARLKRKSSDRRMRPALVSHPRRTALVALACVVVVMAAVVGAYEAIAHIGQEAPVVVITDDSMSPAVTGSAGQWPHSGSTDEVDVTVPVSQDVLKIGFVDLWTRLTATAGIEPNEARLENFRVSFDYPSGSLVGFDLQTLTQDGYELRVSYSESAESLRMYGARLPEFTPYLPSFPPVDALLSALDLVGMKSLLARLDISKSPGTGASLGDDVTGVEMHLADRGDQGVTEIGGQARAYYYEAGDWVQLGPDDGRRTAEKSDVVLVLRKTREDPSAISAGDSTSFIIPAANIGGVVTTSGSAPTTDQPTLSTTTSTSPVQGPKLKWGETAVLEGRTVRVDEPTGDPKAAGSRPGSKVVYSMVTITNTGSEALTFVASELFLEGNSSGSTGIGGPEKTVGGHAVLDSVTLAPGASVTAAVRFSLKQGDTPVKVRLVTASSTNVALASWQ